jgi:hypothetical protein
LGPTSSVAAEAVLIKSNSIKQKISVLLIIYPLCLFYV